MRFEGHEIEREMSLSVGGKARELEPTALRIAHLIQPCGVGTRRTAREQTLGILPAKRMRAWKNVNHALLPVHFSGKTGLHRAIQPEFQPVAVGRRRNLPPERNCTGSGDRCFEPRDAAGVDSSALSRGNAVVGDLVLAEPWRIPARLPRQR